MTTTTKNKSPLRAGDQVHWIAHGPAIGTRRNDVHGAFTHLGERGSVITLTDEILEINRDLNGDSPFDLVDEDQAQIARWGEVKIRRGPAPEGITWYVPGSYEQELAYQEARHKIEISTTDLDERAAKLSVLAQSALGRGRPQGNNTTKYLTEY